MRPRRVGNMATSFSALVILLILLNVEYTGSESLWCYECNTSLKNGRTTECNDPYAPRRSMDLVLCGEKESHHCLKSVILYRHVLMTIRGCVASHKIDNYCYFPEYPDAVIECHFCKNYGCNRQNSINRISLRYLGLLAFTSIVLSKFV